MSLYNMVHGVSPLAPVLLSILNTGVDLRRSKRNGHD